MFYSGFHLKKFTKASALFVSSVCQVTCADSLREYPWLGVLSNEGNDDFFPVRPECAGNDAFRIMKLGLSFEMQMCGWVSTISFFKILFSS